MEKRVVSSLFLMLIVLLLITMPLVSAQTYSGFSKFVDNVKLFFSSGEGKVKLALEIREKELNSAIENAKSGNNEDVVKNLEAAKNKLKIVQEGISPNVADEVRSSVESAENKINENMDINAETSQYFNEYLTEEEKTKLSVNLSEKTFDYCKELASQNYDLMIKDEKCKSYSWMESIVKERLDKERAGDIEKIKEEVSACMNNPKQCNCDEISLASEKANCEKYKASAVRCEFQGDSSACNKIKDIKIEDKGENEQTRSELEKQIIEKYLPAECSEAGVRDGEECKKLIISLNQPKSECMENGVYVGDEKCKEKLVNQGDVVKECVVDGKLVDPEQCRNIVKEGNKPTGEEFALMSGECKERGVYDPVACEEIVNLPRPCKDAGYYTKKECEAMTLNKNLPKECVDAGALTPEACEKLKLPSDCQGAYSREECEKIKIEQKFPDECKSQGEFDTAKCAFIMVGEDIVPTGAEMEYLVRNGLSVEEIPSVCTTGDSVKRFIRSDSCDAALLKLGIILPKPTATAGIAKECMIDERTAVSPKECQNIIKQNIIINTIPKECQDAEVTNPEECGSFMEEKRIEQGIGINMPSECIGISIEECKKIMEEKGIKVEKVEQVQKVEKVQKMCKEGENCGDQSKEYEEITLPNECMKMGVSDVTDCKMIAGKINEERIKNGEKVVVDENGEVDYLHPEQIEKIADDSEKASQEIIKPDFEKAEEIKQEINIIEDSIKTIDIQKSDIASGNNVVDKAQMDKDNEYVTPSGNQIDNSVDDIIGGDSGGDVAPGPEGIVGQRVVESGGNDNSAPSNSIDNSEEVSSENSGGDSGSSGGGESAPVTGAVIGSGDYINSLLGKILKILGI